MAASKCHNSVKICYLPTAGWNLSSKWWFRGPASPSCDNSSTHDLLVCLRSRKRWRALWKFKGPGIEKVHSLSTRVESHDLTNLRRQGNVVPRKRGQRKCVWKENINILFLLFNHIKILIATLGSHESRLLKSPPRGHDAGGIVD